MRIEQLKIKNFRGIKKANLTFHKDNVLIGDNNTGKTTIFEALDLVLGPDRLNRYSPIDEHDFYNIDYLPDADGKLPLIEIDVILSDLSMEDKIFFNSYIEYWNTEFNELVEEISIVDHEKTNEIIRVSFKGKYDEEIDDFEAETFYTKTLNSGLLKKFGKKEKQKCGFLYLRSIRTGSRALSLERGSMMDIILRQNEVRPKMWEDIIQNLSSITIAGGPELGISGIIESIMTEMQKFVPKYWGVAPTLKVSNLTRENLRKIITAFISNENGGNKELPFYKQGTGTINILVLSMLSVIANNKQNVMFAMEEPETAIPPYTQKRVAYELRKITNQSFFTSHSPYIIETYNCNDISVLAKDDTGLMSQRFIELPEKLRLKQFNLNFRTKFCEGFLTPTIIIVEGETEENVFTNISQKLYELNPDKYLPFELLGISTINAGGDTTIPNYAELYSSLGKKVFAICDNQDEPNKSKIKSNVEALFMHSESGMEKLVLNNISETVLRNYEPTEQIPTSSTIEELKTNLFNYFKSKKGDGELTRLLLECTEDEIPEWIKETCEKITKSCIASAFKNTKETVEL